MFVLFGILLCVTIVISYVLFAMSHDRYSDIAHPETKKDYAMCFIPGYFLWFLVRSKLESFDEKE